ncbi:glycosyltransferase [Roseomonas elaeocarpi]|uniref:Glycosyltransferase n=1 Tax=Roseomonas elaeocarpi TaxID=907779 RepID=A0ABV6JLY8_9PROT
MSASRAVDAPIPMPMRRAQSPIRLLTFSSLYPSPGRPNHGVFVENRLRHLVAGGEAESTVLAPVPWFPLRGGRGPAEVLRHGLRVHHPRFLAPPGLGMLTAPATLYAAARAALARLRKGGFDFDLIDAHYLYPDGVAALRLGQELGKPVVITARGSDVSQLPNYRLPRRAIRRAIEGADALIAVSAGLRDGLMALGAPAEKVTVLRNGVDLDLFHPPPSRQAARAALGLGEEPVLISVGHLIERKGHHHVVAALPMLPGHRLLILGEGPERAALLALARQLGVEERVRLVGAQPHAALPEWYGAADAMVLASSREGWANVLLESMACGTPVVASPAWGSREAVRSPAAGLVLEETTPEAVAAGVRRLLADSPDRAATRRYAEGFGWDDTTAGQMAVFRRVLAARAGA